MHDYADVSSIKNDNCHVLFGKSNKIFVQHFIFSHGCS